MATFQSTLPMRGATRWTLPTRWIFCISIHAPHAGSDARRKQPAAKPLISIHAPHAGSDRAGGGQLHGNGLFQSTLPMRGATFHLVPARPFDIHFNPRSPCGERQRIICVAYGGRRISIHAPHAGSDRPPCSRPLQRHYFNPRSPCGERRGSFCACRLSFNFNPRSPCGERQRIICVAYGGRRISIHAPHAGSDPQWSATPAGGCGHFNPRSPCGERLE